jgi:hypothetical protein
MVVVAGSNFLTADAAIWPKDICSRKWDAKNSSVIGLKCALHSNELVVEEFIFCNCPKQQELDTLRADSPNTHNVVSVADKEDLAICGPSQGDGLRLRLLRSSNIKFNLLCSNLQLVNDRSGECMLVTVAT